MSETILYVLSLGTLGYIALGAPLLDWDDHYFPRWVAKFFLPVSWLYELKKDRCQCCGLSMKLVRPHTVSYESTYQPSPGQLPLKEKTGYVKTLDIACEHCWNQANVEERFQICITYLWVAKRYDLDEQLIIDAVLAGK